MDGPLGGGGGGPGEDETGGGWRLVRSLQRLTRRGRYVLNAPPFLCEARKLV